MVTVLWHPLPTERVRYVGEPVAMAWGEDRYEAEDLADAISVDYAPLPPGTPIHDAAPDGVLFSRSVDSGGVDEAMAQAHLVLERTFRTARQSALPLEGRGVVADHDGATGVTTVWTSTQLPHLVRRGVAHALGTDEDLVRVMVPQVGGFGLKASLYAEEIAVAALARSLGRPVRWIEDRTENLLAGTHGHDTRVWLRVAVGQDGRVHAIDADVVTDVGAYSVWPGTAGSSRQRRRCRFRPVRPGGDPVPRSGPRQQPLSGRPLSGHRPERRGLRDRTDDGCNRGRASDRPARAPAAQRRP